MMPIIVRCGVKRRIGTLQPELLVGHIPATRCVVQVRVESGLAQRRGLPTFSDRKRDALCSWIGRRHRVEVDAVLGAGAWC